MYSAQVLTQDLYPLFVNSIRDLFTQQPVSSDIWISVAWCVGILIVAYTLAMATYHRKIA